MNGKASTESTGLLCPGAVGNPRRRWKGYNVGGVTCNSREEVPGNVPVMRPSHLRNPLRSVPQPSPAPECPLSLYPPLARPRLSRPSSSCRLVGCKLCEPPPFHARMTSSGRQHPLQPRGRLGLRRRQQHAGLHALPELHRDRDGPTAGNDQGGARWRVRHMLSFFTSTPRHCAKKQFLESDFISSVSTFTMC